MAWAPYKSNRTDRGVTDRRASGRGASAVARAIALAVMLAPLGACSSLRRSFRPKDDDSFADEPADKLYNEGLYLLNDKRDFKNAAKKFEEVDRQHPYSDWARKSLIMTAYAYYEAGDYDEVDHRRAALRHAASRQPGRGLRAVPDRLVLFRPDPGHHPRPGPHRKGGCGARGGRSQVSRLRICDRRQAQDRDRARSARRQGR